MAFIHSGALKKIAAGFFGIPKAYTLANIHKSQKGRMRYEQ